MTGARLTIVPADPLGRAALDLLAEAAAEARLRYPEFFADGAPAPTNAPSVPRSSFVLAHLDDAVVGCGALRPLDATTAEIKRMFVRQAARRHGVARAIVAQLVQDAAEFGYSSVRLETGNRQPEAIALYAACGFVRIAPFGRYVDDPTSVCFERIVDR
jgi:GNAT superfamily N-acetyltransferase